MYESDTTLWGPLAQNVKLSADVNVQCVGKVDHSGQEAHKYLVKLTKVSPRIARDNNDSKRDILPPKPEEVSLVCVIGLIIFRINETTLHLFFYR